MTPAETERLRAQLRDIAHELAGIRHLRSQRARQLRAHAAELREQLDGRDGRDGRDAGEPPSERKRRA